MHFFSSKSNVTKVVNKASRYFIRSHNTSLHRCFYLKIKYYFFTRKVSNTIVTGIGKKIKR